MQAIITKCIPPTNTKWARIKASCERGSITVYYGFGPVESDHRDAAKALTEKFIKEDVTKYGSNPHENPWARPFITGSLASGHHVHVFVPKGGL